MKCEIIGIEGLTPISDIMSYFIEKGGEVVLLNHMCIYGKNHCISALMHAERSFSKGTNRANNFPAEIMMYVSGERQASKAIKAVKPVNGKMVAIVIDVDNYNLSDISMTRNDSLIDGNEEKAHFLGFNSLLDPHLAALEKVAMLDIEKM